jgi:hypothetical protein
MVIQARLVPRAPPSLPRVGADVCTSEKEPQRRGIFFLGDDPGYDDREDVGDHIEDLGHRSDDLASGDGTVIWKTALVSEYV